MTNRTLKPVLFVITTLIFLLLSSLCLTSSTDQEEITELTFYAASCMAGSAQELVSDFEAMNPRVKISVVSKGSGTLFDNIAEWQRGDVFMPGEESFAIQAVEEGYMESYTPVAYHTLTLIVPEGNPGGITDLEDIINDDVRVVGGGLDTAMGRMCADAIGGTKIYEEILDNYVYLEETKCSGIPLAVTDDQADVGISCYASADRVEGVEVIEIRDFMEHSSIIPIGVLKFSEEEELAAKFVDFVTSRTGKEIIKGHGFDPVGE